MIRHYSKWLVLLAAIALLAVVVIYNSQQISQQDSRTQPAKDNTDIAADVGVTKVSTGPHKVAVDAFGAAKPHYDITLTAQVSGRVTELSDKFETGHIMDKGDLLLTLEDSDYRSALASAENNLASARVELLEAEREAEQALAEWRSSGMIGEPDSPLVLHEPQVAAAKAAAADAEAAVASARKDLEQTRVRAPFDALIISRSVSPGSYLQSGGEIAQLYSADRVEISLPLSQLAWRNLPDLDLMNQDNWPVTLTSVETGQQWDGYVQRTELHLDATTRQQFVIAAFDRPPVQADMLPPGTFVKAEIQGRKLQDLWRLPPSSLSQRDEIWYESNVDLSELLRDLAEEMTYLLAGKPVTTQVSSLPYPCNVPLVPARIILGNLIRNAYQHCWEGTVVIEQQDNLITITNPVESSALEPTANLPDQTGYGLGLELTTTLSKRIGWHYESYEEGETHHVVVAVKSTSGGCARKPKG